MPFFSSVLQHILLKLRLLFLLFSLHFLQHFKKILQNKQYQVVFLRETALSCLAARKSTRAFRARVLQSVKEPLFSRSEDKVLAAIWEEHSIKSGKRESIPLPNGYLFEIHGSILEPHPSGNPGQTSVVCISHGVLFFCVSKDTLNGFFSHGINFLATLGFTQLFHQI